LFDDDAVVGDLLDRGDVQRRGLERAVLAFEAVDLLAELVAALLRDIELVVEFVVDLGDRNEVFAEGFEALIGAHLGIEVETRPIRDRGAA
jgi:hypothetical protein